MGTVNRLDRGELKKPTRLPNGWLRADAHLTRTGVFTYTMPDGSKRRELRLPEEVFNAEALRSFGLVPITDAHPPGFLDAHNAREFTRGSVSAPAKDGEFVRAELLVTDAELIAKLENGEARELSCGYSCELDESPGITPSGEKYDSIQRSIRGNHVAVVEKGRAGPNARVRMDAGEALDDPRPAVLRSEKDQPKRAKTVLKIRIDGVDFEVTNEAVVQAFARHEENRARTLAESVAKLDALKGERDAAAAKADTLKGQLEAKEKEIAELPAKLRVDAQARLELEATAREVLGKGEKFDGLDDAAVRAKVLAKLAPKLDAKGKSADYLRARFDAELERFRAEQEDGEEVETAGEDTDAGEHQDAEEVEVEDAGDEELTPFERNRRASVEAWKATAKAHGLPT